MDKLERGQKAIVKDLKIGEHRYEVPVTLVRPDPEDATKWVVNFDNILLSVESSRIEGNEKL